MNDICEDFVEYSNVNNTDRSSAATQFLSNEPCVQKCLKISLNPGSYFRTARRSITKVQKWRNQTKAQPAMQLLTAQYNKSSIPFFKNDLGNPSPLGISNTIVLFCDPVLLTFFCYSTETNASKKTYRCIYCSLQYPSIVILIFKFHHSHHHLHLFFV